MKRVKSVEKFGQKAIYMLKVRGGMHSLLTPILTLIPFCSLLFIAQIQYEEQLTLYEEQLKIKTQELNNAKSSHYKEVPQLKNTIVTLASASSGAQALLSAASDRHSCTVSVAVKEAKVKERIYYTGMMKKERQKIVN